METVREFRNRILKRNGPKVFKISNSFGTYDIYKKIRKNKWYDIGRPLKEKEYYDIIRLINTYLAQELMNGNDIKFPFKLGTVEFRMKKVIVKYNNDKLVNTNPINWDKTLELWFNDPEAHKEKILVREDRKENYFFRYNTLNADYINKCFFDFYINRDIVNTTRAKAKEGIIGAYLNREEDGEDL